MVRLGVFVLLAIPLVFASSCSGESSSCSVDDDCFMGEFCSDGTCVAGTNLNNGGGNNGGTNNGGTNNGATNNGSTNNGSTNNGGTNNGSTNNGSTNNGSTNNGGTNNGGGACTIDPFDATCQMDDNDSFAEYFKINEEGGPPGCNGGGDDFLGGTTDLLDKQICALEEMDRYNTNLIPCDNTTFIVEAIVKPKLACDHGLWTFEMSVQGNSCENPNDMVRCEELADGSKKIQAFVAPSISIASANLRIGKVDPNAHFEYDVTMTVRQ